MFTAYNVEDAAAKQYRKIPLTIISLGLRCNGRITLIGGPGGLKGRVSKWKTWTVGGLHRKQKGRPAGCTKRKPSVICSLPARLPTGLSCSAACRPALLWSSPARGKSMFYIWQHGPPALRSVLSKWRNNQTNSKRFMMFLQCYWRTELYERSIFLSRLWSIQMCVPSTARAENTNLFFVSANLFLP